MVQEAEEPKSVPAPVLPSKEEVEAHNVSHLPFPIGALRVFVAEDCHLVIIKSTRRRRRQNRSPLSLWITGSLGSPRIERTIHSQCSSCGIARVKASGVTQCRYTLPGSDERFGLHAFTSGLSSSQIRSPALLLSVTLSRMVGTTRLFLKYLPRARVGATEKFSVLFNLCTDLRGSRNLKLRWSPGARCWLGWSSIVPTIFCFTTRVSRLTVTQPTCI